MSLSLIVRASVVDFGAITKMTDEGTENCYVLGITDSLGVRVKYLLGNPEDYSEERLLESAEHIKNFLLATGMQDAQV